jgi:hypothetical protein
MSNPSKPPKLDAKTTSKKAKAASGDLSPKLKSVDIKEAKEVVGGLSSKRMVAL